MEFMYGRTEESITMMCPHCYRMITKKVHISMDDDPEFIFVVHPHLRCPDCNEDMVAIDNEITEEIQSLNLAGYKTRFSCSGHYPYAWQMYVVFENDNIHKAIKKHQISIPKNMHFEKQPQGYILYTNNNLMSSCKPYRKMHEELLHDFKEFVHAIYSASKKAP